MIPIEVNNAQRTYMVIRQVHRVTIFYFILYYLLFRATPEAYGGSQARGPIRATAAGLHHSHSNARSEPWRL